MEAPKRESALGWRWILGVFLLALTVRLAFLLGSADRGWPHSMYYEGDALHWVAWARALARGEPYEFGLPFRAPGVAYLLHWISAPAVAAPFVAQKVLWCVVSAAGCAFLLPLLAAEFPRRAAWLATVLQCFAFGALQTSTSLNNEALYTTGWLLALWGTQRWLARPRASWAVALGVLHGLLNLLRPEHTLFVALLALYLFWRMRRDAVRAGWPMALAFCAALLPWSWRGSQAVGRYNETTTWEPAWESAAPPWSADARAALLALPPFAREGNFLYLSHLARTAGRSEVTAADLELLLEQEFGYTPEPLSRWVLVSGKGGLDFALANHPSSEGGFTTAALQDGVGPNPDFSFARPSHLELYNHGFAVGLGWITEDPGAWLGLVAGKLRRFADGALLGATSWNLPYGRTGLRRPVDLTVPQAPLRELALAVVVAIGFVLWARRRGGALLGLSLVYKLLVTVAFYGYARQAVSVQPVFLLALALSLDAACRAVEARWPARGTGLSRAGWALLGALLVLEIVSASPAGPGQLAGRSLPGSHLVPTPEWGRGAFETAGALEIVRPPKALQRQP